MKPDEIFKGIFTLAVRLLGLAFVYFGLSAIPPLLDLGAIETAGKTDILSATLPIAFDLLVGWWLIGGGLLVRRAYPQAKSADYARTRGQDRADAITPGSRRETADMDAADQKLQSFVQKPK